MECLPMLVDSEEAIEHFHKPGTKTDAEKAYVVGILSKEGYGNKEIREVLKIDKVYTVTHLKRAGTRLSESLLNLWHRNSEIITLGHIRAIAKFPHEKQEELLRGLLRNKKSVHEFERIAKGAEGSEDVDIKRFEQIMGEVIGRQIRIRFNPAKRTGSLTIDYFGLDDLDDIAIALGFNPGEHL